MKIKMNIKRWVGLVLAAAIVQGAAYEIPKAMKALADTNQTTPSVTAFADKSQLMAFSTGEDGDVSKVGKIKLGRHKSYTFELTWYVLGSDSKVNNGKNNIAIFSVDNLQDSQAFYSGDGYQQDPTNIPNTKWDNDEDYGTYENHGEYEWDKHPTEIYANHYGASALRAATNDLSNIATFYEDEKNMMQATTVSTEDYKNGANGKPVYYTTSDKLYSAWAEPIASDYKGTNIIYVGSQNDKKINLKKMTSDNAWYNFWLRTPPSEALGDTWYYANSGAMVASIGDSGATNARDYIGEEWSGAIHPAANLDLTNVLFASSAYAGYDGMNWSGELKSDAAMTIRLAGKTEDVGTVNLVFDETTNDYKIIATAPDTDNRALVVQGYDSDKGDWYYSIAFSSRGEWSANDILDIVKNQTSKLDLSECKIWIEKKGGDNCKFNYAVLANTETHNHTFPEDKYEADETYHWQLCTDSNCTADDKGKSETLKEHDYENVDWEPAEDGHYHICKICKDNKSIKDMTDHKFGLDGICIDCGYDIEHIHKLEYVKGGDATCTKKAFKESWRCTKCSTKYKASDETVAGAKILETFTNDSDLEYGEPLGHSEGTTYKKDATNHWHECTRCGEKLSVAKHTFEDNKCTVCGYIKSSNSSGGSSSSGSNTGWIKDNKGWRFTGSDGLYIKGSTITDANGNKLEKVLWQRAGSNYFAFGSDGYLVTGWINDAESGKWYYCDENNGRLTGWFYSTADSHWYYLDPSTGAMLTGWQNINGKDYYLAGEPAAPTYSFDAAAKKWIYNNQLGYYPFGAMYENTVTPDNYKVDASGARLD